MDIAEHETRPIPLPPGSIFHAYLLRHKLCWRDVARASGVLAVTVWSIDHGLLVPPEHARKVRRGLYLLTGEPYTGPIATIGQQAPREPGRGQAGAVSHYDAWEG